MANKALGRTGLTTLWGIAKGFFATKTHTHTAATTSADGMLSAADKAKLDGIAENANNYTHPSHTAAAAGFYKVTVDASGHVTKATKVAKSDITGLGIPESDTKYSPMTGASASAAGAQGLVPAPEAGKQAAFLKGDGTWDVPENTTYQEATTSKAGLLSAADKDTINNLPTTYAKKTNISGVYKFKGSVASYSNLPQSATAGDVYNVEDSGMNYAWDGDSWDALGGIFEIEELTDEEIEAICV